MDDVALKGFLRGHLRQRGFIVYPSEIVTARMRLLDVAGFKNGYFYAFECKSFNDHIKFDQLEAYAKSFDNVVVVSEKLYPRLREKFKNKGYGLWLLKNGEVEEVIKPCLQSPVESCRKRIETKFKRVTGYRKLNMRFTQQGGVFIPISLPTTLEDYVSSGN